MELYHHGVKGQKWGVRHGPPYPIEDRVLRTGTKLNSVAMSTSGNTSNISPENYRKKGTWMYTYNNDYDQKVYKGPFSKYLVMCRGAQYLDEHKYEVVKDLRMPTKEERVNEFVEIYNKNKKVVSKELADMRQMLILYKVGSEAEQKEFSNFNPKKFDINDKDQRRVAYAMFNHMMENVQRYKTTQLYKKNIEKKFDAMVDDNNQGVYNDAKDPIIVFRAEEVLRTIGSQPITSDEIIKNTEEIREKLAKKGLNVKL